MIIKENTIEQLFVDTFNEIGYQNCEIFNDLNLWQIINENLLRKTLLKINNLQNEYIDEAIKKILHINASNSLEANIQTLKWLKSGISIKIQKYWWPNHWREGDIDGNIEAWRLSLWRLCNSEQIKVCLVLSFI